MAELHSHVLALLSPILEGPLSVLAERAIARIQSDEAPIPPEDRLEVQRRDDTPRGRGLRQLDLLHETIALPLKHEIELCRRLTELAPQFDINAVTVAPGTTDSQRTEQRPDQLLDPARIKAIDAFLRVSLEAWERTYTAVEGGDGQ